ncbi:MAG: hypothetical protein GKR86_00565 [Ilumatobacter sp.]|nr:hypothetical protein [Ilumatobacter sp.]
MSRLTAGQKRASSQQADRWWSVAELCYATVQERNRRLIDVAHPDHRAELTAQAEAMRYV